MSNEIESRVIFKNRDLFIFKSKFFCKKCNILMKSYIINESQKIFIIWNKGQKR